MTERIDVDLVAWEAGEIDRDVLERRWGPGVGSVLVVSDRLERLGAEPVPDTDAGWEVLAARIEGSRDGRTPRRVLRRAVALAAVAALTVGGVALASTKGQGVVGRLHSWLVHPAPTVRPGPSPRGDLDESTTPSPARNAADDSSGERSSGSGTGDQTDGSSSVGDTRDGDTSGTDGGSAQEGDTSGTSTQDGGGGDGGTTSSDGSGSDGTQTSSDGSDASGSSSDGGGSTDG